MKTSPTRMLNVEQHRCHHDVESLFKPSHIYTHTHYYFAALQKVMLETSLLVLSQAIPMSFLCAEWFTTAYARNTPLPLALCALDLFLVRLDDVTLRLGLAILEV